jgi:hypothetical protein
MEKHAGGKEPEYKVYDTEHIDLTGSTTRQLAGANHGLLGHGDDLHHRGTRNGVVTTYIPTPVTSAKPSSYIQSE